MNVKSMVMKTYSIDEIKEIAPSVFTTTAAPGLSDKYIQTPTSRVIEDLIELGWQVTKVQEIKTRKNKGYQKHMVVFRNPNITIKGNDGDDVFPQILLTNSHDGKSAFNFRVGLFRLVCSNGLVVSDKDFSNVSIRHINYTFESLREKMNEVISKLPGLVQKINLFKSTTLTQDQMNEFARKAAELRTKQTINTMDVLSHTRDADAGNDLWAVYNRVQEKLMSGDFRYGNKTRKARSIKTFQKDIELNEKLFQLAETFI